MFPKKPGASKKKTDGYAKFADGGQTYGDGSPYNYPGSPAQNAASFGITGGAGVSLGRAPVNGANFINYQQGLNPQQQQKGLNNLQQGMGMAQQSYNQMGRMGQMFQNDAQNAGNAAYNPAIGAYQQALNQNSQNIGAQLASQRGSSVNPGLAARNVGQQGAMAAQNAAGQMSSQVAQFKQNAQGLASSAYQGQGQMAGVYGNIANAYAQAGLENQGQILNAIAARNAAEEAMQANMNSSNVAMQNGLNAASVDFQNNSNTLMAQQMMNNNKLGVDQYNNSVNANAGVYSALRQGTDTGGIFGHGGFLGLGLAKGGVVPGKVQNFAQGGQVRHYAGGSGPIGGQDLAAMGGGAGTDPSLHIMDPESLDMHADPSMSKMPNMDPGQGTSAKSMIGQLLASGGAGGGSSGLNISGGGKQSGDGASQLVGMGIGALLGLNKGGQVPRYAQGGMTGAPSVPGNQGQGQGQGQATGSTGAVSTGNFPGQANGGAFPGQANGGAFPGQGLGVGGTPPAPREGTGQNVWDNAGPPGVMGFNIPGGGQFGGGFPGQQSFPGRANNGMFPGQANGGMFPAGANWQNPMGFAQGSIVPDTNNPGVVQAQGPSMQNFALAGSPNPQIAMPSTGLPMGNAQTRGGGAMPAQGQSGGYGQPQQPRPPGMAFGGRMLGRTVMPRGRR